MQNFHGGDYSETITERRMLQDKSNLVTHNKNLDDSINDDETDFKVRAQAQMDKDVKYRQELKEQCEDNYRRSQFEYEESHSETSKFQKSQNSMSEQYHKDLQHRHDESVKLHNEREGFKRDCVDFKDVQKALIRLEEERINSQRSEISDRSFVVNSEREQNLKDKDDLNDRMCSQIMAAETDRLNRENELDMKHNEEDREKLRIQDEKDHDKLEGDKKDLRDGLLSQIEENKQSVRDEVQREIHYRDQAMAVMELEDEREKERARKKKELDDQYFSDLRQQIADNAARRKKQKEDDAL